MKKLRELTSEQYDLVYAWYLEHYTNEPLTIKLSTAEEELVFFTANYDWESCAFGKDDPEYKVVRSLFPEDAKDGTELRVRRLLFEHSLACKLKPHVYQGDDNEDYGFNKGLVEAFDSFNEYYDL